MKNTLPLVVLLACLTGCATTRQPVAEAHMNQRLRLESKRTIPLRVDYLLSLPAGYEQSRDPWPLLLFLHGAGERGTNLSKVSVHGPPKLVKEKRELPFIVVSPQCPSEETWRDDTLLALLDEVCAKYRVDTNRVYLTGLSMGGFGTWSLGLNHPQRFAAIAPICGGGNILSALLTSRSNTRALQSLGVWAFHGAKDPVVPLVESERMVATVKKAGAKDVQLTIYPEASHDSWTETYENPRLYQWFLEHHR